MENFISYDFKNIELLDRALTHSSYSHESRNKNLQNNERLEFLGDAVLELVVSNFIFNQFTDFPEGELTRLRASVVCGAMLSVVARKLDVGKYLKLGKGEENTGGRQRDSILADAFEAIIGAIYLDGGIEEAERFILRNLKDAIFEKKSSFMMSDCKTYLQELIQKTSHEPLEYIVVDESGPAHNKVFEVEIRHIGKVLGKGSGKSKKEAEQKAAADAIKKVNG